MRNFSSGSNRMIFRGLMQIALAAGTLFLSAAGIPAETSAGRLSVDPRSFKTSPGTTAAMQESGDLRATWPVTGKVKGEMILDLRAGEPLIRSLGLVSGAKPVKVIATRLEPALVLSVGERDRTKAGRAFEGMVFFDNPRERPYETHAALLQKKNLRVSSEGSRTTVSIGEVTAGSFRGELRLSVFRNSPLVEVDMVMSSDQEFRAFLYDAGIVSAEPGWHSTVWLDPEGRIKRQPVKDNEQAMPLAVKYRTIAGEGPNGAIAVFPAPHQYFAPLDFADNFKFTWHGRGYRELSGGFGFGVRQPLEGDKRWVPWVDAPPGTSQHLRLFLLLSGGDGEQAIREVARFTRDDRFKKLRGYRTFTSHYHVEHTTDFLDRQKQENTTGIPRGLETPGFITKFKETGVEIVHLAEFHYGWTPKQPAPDRLRMLKVMHDECARLSDDQLLLLPGEEPNVHLGGHWMSFFPRPVYWVLNRAEGEPFVEEVEGYGTVYRVGSADDVLQLMKKESGLMWAAHARIKGSREFPDGYRTTDFFASDQFLGAAWKAMPADFSRPKLGWRVLDLLDDMNQWGRRKQILGEVDVFKVQPDYELYAHMNINYLKLDKLPKFRNGWQPVLEALRGGRFFTSTGEILIPRFSISGRESGDTLKLKKSGRAILEAEIEWTFPLAFAEIVSGDGRTVFRQRMDLTDSGNFGSRRLRLPIDLTGRKWVRFEVWDIAANGAFTQPVWLDSTGE